MARAGAYPKKSVSVSGTSGISAQDDDFAQNT